MGWKEKQNDVQLPSLIRFPNGENRANKTNPTRKVQLPCIPTPGFMFISYILCPYSFILNTWSSSNSSEYSPRKTYITARRPTSSQSKSLELLPPVKRALAVNAWEDAQFPSWNREPSGKSRFQPFRDFSPLSTSRMYVIRPLLPCISPGFYTITGNIYPITFG